MTATKGERVVAAAVWMFVAWVAAANVLNDGWRGFAAVAFVAAMDMARRERDTRPATTREEE